jgi:hypothetical protein
MSPKMKKSIEYSTTKNYRTLPFDLLAMPSQLVVGMLKPDFFMQWKSHQLIEDCKV